MAALVASCLLCAVFLLKFGGSEGCNTVEKLWLSEGVCGRLAWMLHVSIGRSCESGRTVILRVLGPRRRKRASKHPRPGVPWTLGT